MNKSDRIQARVEPDLKAAAEAIFSRLGISSGDAIRMFYHQVTLTGSIPFSIKIPNSETLTAMEETKAPETLKRYDSFSALRDEQGV
ncbi:MAG: type II toxin-antitoxin system RelB/DinJ family antitoxin [Methylococcales bacterium]